jgi:hypothetical protein
MNPAPTAIEVRNHGQIDCIILPAGWTEGKPRNNVVGNSSMRHFHPDSEQRVTICMYYRGRAVNKQAAEDFRSLIKQPARKLSHNEIESIATIIRDKADPADFILKTAKTEDFNGRRVLIVEGRYKEIEHDTICLYVDADGSGKFVQEIFYQAPVTNYGPFENEALKALNSIKWK